MDEMIDIIAANTLVAIEDDIDGTEVVMDQEGRDFVAEYIDGDLYENGEARAFITVEGIRYSISITVQEVK